MIGSTYACANGRTGAGTRYSQLSGNGQFFKPKICKHSVLSSLLWCERRCALVADSCASVEHITNSVGWEGNVYHRCLSTDCPGRPLLCTCLLEIIENQPETNHQNLPEIIEYISSDYQLRLNPRIKQSCHPGEGSILCLERGVPQLRLVDRTGLIHYSEGIMIPNTVSCCLLADISFLNGKMGVHRRDSSV